jgi:UDP-glucuronate 4-epimerase
MAGFIASRVAAWLHDQGHDVWGIDNFNDAYDVRLKEWRRNDLRKLGKVFLEAVDITDRDGLERYFEARKSEGIVFDAVIHLAARY